MEAIRQSQDRAGSRLGARSRYPKVFVGGCPRSGTTWLARTLASHPDVVAYGGESHVYDRLYEPLMRLGPRRPGTWIQVCRDYFRAPRNIAAGIHEYVSSRKFLALAGAAGRRVWAGEDPESVAASLVRGIFEDYYRKHRGDGRRRLVEKTPSNLLWAPTILRHFPEARLIEVMRDGRDVCVSLEMRARTRAWAPADRADQADLWRRYAEKGLELRAESTLRHRIHQVRYERMQQDPLREQAALFDFLGLDHDPDLLASIRAQNHISRYSTKSGHNRKGIVGDWRNHFTPEDEAVFRERVGDVFERAGYRYP